MSKTYVSPPILSDEQIAKVIVELGKLVDEDAMPLLITYTYEMAYKYNENGNAALFAYEVGKIIKKITG